MSENKLFRKAALEKLASPEQLDLMMQVTPPRAWMALVGLALLLLVALIWAVFGSVGTQIRGQGILLRGEAVLAVTASSQGPLSAVHVRPGDRVTKGQVLAEVAQPDLLLSLENQQQRLRELTAQAEAVAPLEQENLAQALAALDAETVSTRRSMADFDSQASALRERVEVQAQLVEQGLITRSALLATRSALAQAEQARAATAVRLAQIASERTAQERSRQQGGAARRAEIDEAKRQLASLSARRDAVSVITSPYDGRVLEVSVDPGNLVAPGMQVLTLENEERPLEAVLYIAAAEGKKIRTGMQVRITPSTVRPEEYGFMLATVRSVSDFPVSPEALRRVLRNDSLVEALASEGPPIEVIATLEPNPETPSGFAWSSGNGPPTGVFSGTLSEGGIVIERRRPIAYVLPMFQRLEGAN